MDALQEFENILVMQKESKMFPDEQVLKTLEEIIIICNILGMVYLKKGLIHYKS